MFSKISDTYVDMAVLAEFIAARDQHGAEFDCFQEFVEVLHEEVVEAFDEVMEMYHEMRKPTLNMDEVEKRARLGMKELAQVLAVCKKYTEQMHLDEGITPEDIERMR